MFISLSPCKCDVLCLHVFHLYFSMDVACSLLHDQQHISRVTHFCLVIHGMNLGLEGAQLCGRGDGPFLFQYNYFPVYKTRFIKNFNTCGMNRNVDLDLLVQRQCLISQMCL